MRPPSLLKSIMSEITKRKKGQILNNNERQLILNLMNYLKKKDSHKSISEIIREISKATGCSERTIYKIRKEASKGITVVGNRTRLRKKENKNSRNVKYDSFVKSSIRRKIHNYFLQNNSPTLNTILCLVNNDPDLPNFKRSTLHTLLKEIGFVYEQKGKKSLLTEKEELVKSRQAYLRDIQKYRNENRWIIYTGETIISLMETEEQKLQDVPIQNINTIYINDLNCTALVYTINTTDPEVIKSDNCADDSKNEISKKSKEVRLTVMHAGSMQGFIQDAESITLCKRKTKDVQNYEQWFLEKLIPKIPPDSVIVTDNNAPYHKLEETFPDVTWKKQQIKNWLSSKNINTEQISAKKELLAVVNNIRPLYSTKYKIDQLAKERGIIILSLPAFHYELNPLNMVWAQIKYHVRSNVKSFKVKKIKELIKESFQMITQGSWMSYIHHVREMEDLLWNVDAQQGEKDMSSSFNL